MRSSGYSHGGLDRFGAGPGPFWRAIGVVADGLQADLVVLEGLISLRMVWTSRRIRALTSGRTPPILCREGRVGAGPQFRRRFRDLP